MLVVQALHGLSDHEAVEALTFDLRWKAACELAITDTASDPSTLTYWPRRLAASGRPDRIAEIVADRKQGHDYSRPGKPEIAWDDLQARDELVSVLVTDALAMLAGSRRATRAATGWRPIRRDGGVAGAGRLGAATVRGVLRGQRLDHIEAACGARPLHRLRGTRGRYRSVRPAMPARARPPVSPDCLGHRDLPGPYGQHNSTDCSTAAVAGPPTSSNSSRLPWYSN